MLEHRNFDSNYCVEVLYAFYNPPECMYVFVCKLAE